MRWSAGPGVVVAAAFVGPGTVTTALVAGASFGAALLWAVVLSVLVTFVLQEAALRLAAGARLTIGEALRRAPGPPVLRRAGAGLVLLAVVAGAAAFQAGNLLGAGLAADALRPGAGAWIVLAAADAAFLLLWFGRGRAVETALGGLVAAMAVAFVAELALLPVDWGAAARGLVPSAPEGADLLVLALVGTTVVPYNLFLHGSLVKARGWGAGDVRRARLDLALALAVGGLLTAAIVLVAAAAIPGAPPRDAAAMARALGPLAGPLAGALFAAGLFAAAFTSAVTAPLAAAYAAAHTLGWGDDPRGARFRAVWGGVLLVGTAVALSRVEPVAAIVAAQAANGVLLPLVAAAAVAAAASGRLLGPLRSSLAWRLAGGVAVAVALALGLRLIYASFLRAAS